MKKTTSLMLVLLFSAVMLLGEAINAAPLADPDRRDFCCFDLEGCSGLTCCAGPSTGSFCTMTVKMGLLFFVWM